MKSYPLFPSIEAEDLRTELLALFERWLASKPGRSRQKVHALANESAHVYRDMWGAFASFCIPLDEEGLHYVRVNPLQGVRREQMQLFLSLPNPGPRAPGRGRVRNDALALRYAWRMLHLIDRVLTFHRIRKKEKSAGPTAAAALLLEAPYRYANSAALNPETEILSDGELRRLMALLTAPLPSNSSPRGEWRLVRDRALVALMLGAGLGPGDAQGLLLDGLALEDGPVPGVPWRLTVPADGLSPEHQTPVAQWAGELLARWLALRTAKAIAGDFVFPSTLSGKQLSRPAVHSAAVSVLEAAEVMGGAPFRLRHTFAVRQLTKGYSEEQVGAWMGMVELRTMQRYRKYVVKAQDLA